MGEVYEDSLFFGGSLTTCRARANGDPTWDTARLFATRPGYADEAAAKSDQRRERRMPTLNETFSVSNPDHAWSIISDLNKLVPCVPGAKVASADSPESVKAEIDVKMGSMGMKFSGPVTIESADAGSKTVKIKAKTKEAGGQSAANGDVTISVAGGTGTVNAVANVNGKAASMGEGTVVAVLTQLVKQFTANVGKA
jgi:carbon monoxide dehydrogenase subunit G